MDWAEGGGEKERAGNFTIWPFPEENLTIKNLSLSFGEKKTTSRRRGGASHSLTL